MDSTRSMMSTRSVASKLPSLISKLERYHKSCPSTKPHERVAELTEKMDLLLITKVLNSLLDAVYDSDLDQEERVALAMNLFRRNGYPELNGLKQDHYLNLKRDLMDLIAESEESNMTNAYRLESMYLTSAIGTTMEVDGVSLNRSVTSATKLTTAKTTDGSENVR